MVSDLEDGMRASYILIEICLSAPPACSADAAVALPPGRLTCLADSISVGEAS